MTGLFLGAEVSTLKENSGVCSFMVIPWWCPHPKPTFPGSPIQHQRFPHINQHRPDPAGPLWASSLVPVQLVQSTPALGRVAEVKTKAMQPGAGCQPLLLWGDELGLWEAEEGRRG